MTDLYRLVYTSLNQLEGRDAERAAAVAEILSISQRNNGKVGVTGALLFNGGCFAQVLEGPRKAVESTFERIQRDPRHSEVNVLQCEPVEARGFSNWSMAFIGHSAKGRAMWETMASQTGFDLGRIEGDQLFATLKAIVVEEEGLASETPPPTAVVNADHRSGATTAEPRERPFDGDRLRAELLDRTGGTASHVASVELPSGGVIELARRADHSEGIRTTGSAAETAVLRASLSEERERTTELRRSLDEARIALALATEEVRTLRHHRDHWAGRARALAAAMVQEPSTGGMAEDPAWRGPGMATAAR